MKTEATTKKISGLNWYRADSFPLIPSFVLKEASEYNTQGFVFKWLFFKIWSIDSAVFELSIVMDDHWGIGVIGLFPYFRWAVAIPCPEKLGIWWNKKTSRARNIWKY